MTIGVECPQIYVESLMRGIQRRTRKPQTLDHKDHILLDDCSTIHPSPKLPAQTWTEVMISAVFSAWQ